MRDTRSLVLIAFATACVSGAVPGAPCSRTSECESPLVCRLGRCRTECVGDRDCPIGARCLFGTETAGSCSLATEDGCTGSSCAAGLVCTASGCRDACTDVCRGDFTCVAGACAPVDVDAGVPSASRCASTRDCPIANACVDEDGLSVCQTVCTTAADCTGDVACLSTPLAGGGGSATVCDVECDPATSAGCPTGAFCAFDYLGAGYTSFCRGAQAGAMGEGCPCSDGGNSVECIGGLVCGRERADLIDRCVRPCRAGETCDGGESCVLPSVPFTRAGVAWGYCPVGPAAACP